jgi:hypothetical protein
MLAQYELVSLLGAGGMGDVYYARDTRLGRHAAVKVLRNVAEPGDKATARFLREARAVANLDHPNICTLYEVGADRGHEFLAMQFIEGETLAARLKRGPLRFDEALRIGVELTTALVYAHSKNILHRDLKPHNVMLQPDGRVKLLDFGLAKVSAIDSELSRAVTDAALTQHGVVVGTAEYMSPEQMSGGALDARSDIFSLGLILYELIGGRHPYRGQTPALTMSGILTKPYPPLTSHHVAEAPALNPILKKTLSVDPAERYATAADLLVDLTRLQREHGAGVRTGAPDRETGNRRSALIAVIAGAVVALAVAAVFLLNRHEAPPPATPAPPPLDRAMTFWFDVRAGDAASPLSRSLGDAPLANGWKLRVNAVSPAPGFLYLLDQEGDEAAAPLALVYPVADDRVDRSNRQTTGWYGFANSTPRDHLWLVWSADAVPELEALRPLVNAKDLGRIADPAQAQRVRAWLAEATARQVRATPETDPVQMTLSYSGPAVVRHILLRHEGRQAP